jgi:hypothetical protein
LKLWSRNNSILHEKCFHFFVILFEKIYFISMKKIKYWFFDLMLKHWMSNFFSLFQKLKFETNFTSKTTNSDLTNINLIRINFPLLFDLFKFYLIWRLFFFRMSTLSRKSTLIADLSFSEYIFLGINVWSFSMQTSH